MQNEQYYAHVKQNGKKQTVMEHLLGTAERAGSCLRRVGLENSAYLAGLLHDIGKFTEKFQDYLSEGDRGKRGSVIHTFQGCRYLLEQCPDPAGLNAINSQFAAELLAFAAGAHHGMFDCVSEDGKIGLKYRKEKPDTSYQEALAGLFRQGVSRDTVEKQFSLSTEEIDRVITRIEQSYEKDSEYCFEIGLLARLLLSAVIEGDRHDTAAFMNETAAPPCYEDMRPLWRDTLHFMEKKVAQLTKKNPVEMARATISDLCQDFAEQPPGIYRLNVPTGGGKTLSSLRYALAHAEKYNQKRLIFTSPLLSILEQNAVVIREYVGDDSLILEHHSNLVQTEPSREQLDERELLLQSWNTPIIITTLVQLLNCMFDGKTSSIRRFQALCNSVIVIDEVQTVPTKMLSLFNLAIRFLAEQCGATVILCSATQPYLEGLDHPLLPPKDIVHYDPKIWNVFLRTKLVPLGNRCLEELPELIETLMENTDSLLVVCNRKDEAAYLLEQTKSFAYVSYHLSASMCMQHRRDVVDELKKSLLLRKTLCIATQVIEAGVDISFQCVLRLTAGMDSIVQAAGRCNRNGESSTPSPVYIVNCTDEKLGKLQDIQRGKTATLSLLNKFQGEADSFRGDLSSDVAIRYYYKAFYSDLACHACDYLLPNLQTTMLDLLSENVKFISRGGAEIENWGLRQAFQTAGKAFSVFDENTVDVLVPYKEGAALISQMCEARCASDPAYCESLIKRAAAYTVSLYDYQRRQLESAGALFQTSGGNALALLPDYYDDCTGLKVDGTNMSFWEV